MINKLCYKLLKTTIDNLIDLSEVSTKNTYFLCGINNTLINYFTSSKWCGGVINDTEEFHFIKMTKNGIILEYKGNLVVLQKNTKENKICENHKYYYNFYDKPLNELTITDIHELDDDSTDS